MKLATILLTFSLSAGILGCSDASFDVAPQSQDTSSVGSSEDGGPRLDAMSDSSDSTSSTTDDSATTTNDSTPSMDSSPSDDTSDASSETTDSKPLPDTTPVSDTASSSPDTTFALPTHDAFGSCAGSSPDDPFKLGYCMSKGDYIDQGFARTASMSKATVTLRIDDQTNGCSAGSTHRFDVVLDSVKIGQLAWTTPLVGTAGVRTLSNAFTFASRAPSAAPSITIQAAESVCSGGGSWQWRSGGSVTIQ